MAVSASARLPNPYIGPRPFHLGEAIFGRERDVRRLLDVLLVDRFVLLQAPSGAGKTSLVQAGLIPLLQVENFGVLPTRITRLAQDMPGLTVRDQYLLNVLLSLEASLPSSRPLEELVNMGLDAYLNDRRERQDDIEAQVLIFDQLEELVLDPMDQLEKVAFMSKVGSAIRGADCWALFITRDEYVGPLYRHLNALRLPLSTFRLEFLEEAAAREAIQIPARVNGIEFSDTAVAQLLEDLRRAHIQQPDGTTGIVLAPYIEPVQLQVVCRRLWQHLDPNTVTITERDIAEMSDTTDALASYYGDAVAAAASVTGVSERAIRDWFEFVLITEGGFRSQTLHGPRGDESGQAVRVLQDSYLVRAEHRAGAIWFELGHDNMIYPIRESNHEWRYTHLQRWQVQANEWYSNRQNELLLQGTELRRALEQARDAELTPIDREYLEEGRRAENRDGPFKRTRIGIGLPSMLALVELVVIVLLLILLVRKG